MKGEEIEIFDPAQADAVGIEHPALFLSASIPYERTSGTPEQRQKNASYLPPLRTEIRSAIVQLARFAFARDIQLVFGGHPAISPLILQATRAVPDTGRLRVAIFQSAMFHRVMPQATVDLATERAGKIVWTEGHGSAIGEAPPDPARIASSLERMREQMIAMPGLVAGIFVGGMDGVEAESEIFGRVQPQLPRYSLAGTGGAAKILFDGNPAGYRGRVQQSVLESTNFARVARLIFEDLGLS
ncbi:MAG: hypothetical protein AB1Z98_18520 [Nannocystaceae bacterium]